MERLEVQNQILDRVFHGKLKTAAAVIALRDAGVSAAEAKRLVLEGVRMGKERRKAMEGGGK